ncbi:hypothetical protein EJ02DRAFT_119251 [Clathrospora elynae]|uniref:Uncharacterized protein n=1 Tax=Clathrospora elynae TaxID=706981 RepID=A0A6A5SB46_9PLEO|nr:hypothetical protein EJ02DRAFT_119251 [Clathrospora elynae]
MDNTHLLAHDVQDALQGSCNAIGCVHLEEMDLIPFRALPTPMLGCLADKCLHVSNVAALRLREDLEQQLLLEALGSINPALGAEQAIHVPVESRRNGIAALLELCAVSALLEPCLTAGLPSLSNTLGAAEADSCQKLINRNSAASNRSVLDKRLAKAKRSQLDNRKPTGGAVVVSMSK